MANKVTLKQIAEQAGVSLTTVHRVLNNKEGCSEQLKENILRIAKEQGYTVNLTAQSLRKQPLHVALVFPRQGFHMQYFIQRILDGYLRCRSELNTFNIIFQEYYLNGSDPSSSQLQLLKQIWRGQPTHYDGLVAYGLSMDEPAQAILNRIVGNGTKVVLLERAPESLSDICRVEVNDALAGGLAADLLSGYIHCPGTVAVLNQELGYNDPNGMACADSLAKLRPDLKVVQQSFSLGSDQHDAIAALLASLPDLVGVYATSARHTASCLRAMESLSLRPQSAIGSELFEESYQALQDRRLDAVIDKRPEKIGYIAPQLLFDNLVKGKPLPQLYQVTPRVALRTNSGLYYKEKESIP